MESALEQETHVFVLTKLHTAYRNYLITLNIIYYINRTSLKGELIDYFLEYGIQEQSDLKKVISVFSSEGIHSLLRNKYLFSQNSEVL